MSRNCVSYYRTSSLKNVGEDKDSLKRQKSVVHRFCENNGYEISGEFYETMSGDNDILSRPVFNEMLNFCDSHDIKTIVFENTTRFAGNVVSGHNIHQTMKSPYPAYNVWRRNEPVATDTIYAEVPAIGTNGQTQAQIFIGRKTLVADMYGMGTDKEFVNTLEDNIRKRGAMDTLISDSAQVETSKRVQDILRALIIGDHQSEPNYQHQNFAEH